MTGRSSNDRRPRVLLLLPSLRGGGAQRVAVHLLNRCDRERVDIRMGLLHRTGPFLDDVDADRVTSSPIRPDLMQDKGNTSVFSLADMALLPFLGPANVARLTADAAPDIVVTFVKSMCVAAYLARLSRHQRRPVWIAREGTNPLQEVVDDFRNPVIRKGFLGLLKQSYRTADCFLTISHEMGHDLNARLGIRPGRLRTIHNPIDADRISELSTQPISPITDRPYIVTAGRLEHQKGHDILLRAFAASAAAAPFDLVILGDGSQRPALERLIAELGLGGRVHLPGFSDNPFAWFARARLFVLPSRWEGFGNVIPEAMASGVAVLATDCDYGPKEILAHGESGWIARTGDAGSLTEAFDTLLGTSGLTDSLCERAAIRVRDFDIEHVVDLYTELFCELADFTRTRDRGGKGG